MNRCPSFARSGAAALLVLVLSAGATSWPGNAAAQGAVRQFPQAAKRGALTVTAPPEVLINGAVERLSPGVRIRGVNNLLVMSASLVGKTYIVNYVREKQGLIQEIWLLNQYEVEEKRSGMEPVTNFVFESMGDKPKTDDGKTPFDQLPKFPKQ